jgi:hypothetical protein
VVIVAVDNPITDIKRCIINALPPFFDVGGMPPALWMNCGSFLLPTDIHSFHT